ncbi:MAG TPA: biopolymer transporter ExbD [Verrucomicrobiae bacterium]|nr:biopolymer transporter ExbD [Verrucomicrobiae bacterium]
MTFKTNCHMSKGLVDPAPLVNVVFLLLLFFMLNSQMVMQSGVPVVLPGVGPTPVVSSFQTLVVTVASDDLLFFKDQPIAMDKLEQALRDEVQRTRAHELVIKADKQVSLGAWADIASAANRAGITTVNMAARPGAASGSAN